MYSSSHFFNDCGVKLKFTAGEKALKWPIGAGDLVGGLFSLSASPKFKKKKKNGGGTQEPISSEAVFAGVVSVHCS